MSLPLLHCASVPHVTKAAFDALRPSSHECCSQHGLSPVLLACMWQLRSLQTTLAAAHWQRCLQGSALHSCRQRVLATRPAGLLRCQASLTWSKHDVLTASMASSVQPDRGLLGGFWTAFFKQLLHQLASRHRHEAQLPSMHCDSAAMSAIALPACIWQPSSLQVMLAAAYWQHFLQGDSCQMQVGSARDMASWPAELPGEPQRSQASIAIPRHCC